MQSDGRWSDYPETSQNIRGLVELTLPGVAGNKATGPDRQYLLDVEIADLLPPQVIEVGGLPADGAIAEESIGPSFTVTFNEALDSLAVTASGTRPIWSYGGHFYTLTEGSGSWTEMEAEAQNTLGGHLVTIDDVAEQDFLHQTLEKLGTNLWIGLSDAAVEGDYLWADGTALGYTNWRSGEPSSYDYAYMESNGGWRLYHDTWGDYRGVIELTGADTDGDGLPDVLDSFAEDPLNAWDLREAGADGVFDTEDDRIHQVQLATDYDGGATVRLQADGTLGTGSYRFTANSTLKDLSGNRLDGNANGSAGDSYYQSFTIQQPDGYLFEGWNSDTMYTATELALVEDPELNGLWIGSAVAMDRQDPAIYYDYYSDPDYWKVELQVGDIVTVSMDTPESGVDAYLQLLNASGSVLAGDDDAGPGRDARISHYVVGSTGTY